MSTARERALTRLVKEVADALEAEAEAAGLAERRAIYWRQVAVELASGVREPYPGTPAAAVQALLRQAPSWAAWEPGPEEVTPLDRSLLLRWWARGEQRPLGQPADNIRSKETA